jgi:hypothetical protein
MSEGRCGGGVSLGSISACGEAGLSRDRERVVLSDLWNAGFATDADAGIVWKAFKTVLFGTVYSLTKF